jgi:Secretion system C-terminal sorting domain
VYQHRSLAARCCSGYKNRCGWTNTPYVLNLFNSCGFSFSASPNPATETITISDLDPEQETSVAIVDKNNNAQRVASGKGEELLLDVRDLPNGLYILQLKQKDITETQQILINH